MSGRRKAELPESGSSGWREAEPLDDVTRSRPRRTVARRSDVGAVMSRKAMKSVGAANNGNAANAVERKRRNP